MIPCLCSFLFTVPSSPFAELVGEKLLHLLTQTVLLLKHPTVVFVAVANAKPPINKNVPNPFSRIGFEYELYGGGWGTRTLDLCDVNAAL